MAFSWQESTVASGTQNITCDIEYLDKSYIHVYLDGEETTAFSWTSDTVIRLNTALTKDTVVLLIRKTEREYLYIMFASGAPFIEANVDSQNKQFLHLAQELVEGRAIPGFYGDISFNGYRITNVGDPEEATDAANRQYVDTAVQDEAAIRAAADAALSATISANWQRTLRVPEASVAALPAVDVRKNKLLACNSQGNPIAVLPESGSAADVLIDLASTEAGLGDSLVGHGDGGTVRDYIHYLTPQSQGAPCNGVDDDSAWFNALVNSSKKVVVPAGNYVLDCNKILVTKDNCEVEFDENAKVTVINTSGLSGANVEAAVFKLAGSTSGTIRNFRLRGGKFTYPNDTVCLVGVLSYVDGVSVEKVEAIGLRLLSTNDANNVYANSTNASRSKRISVSFCKATASTVSTRGAAISFRYSDYGTTANNIIYGYFYGIMFWGGDSNPGSNGGLGNERKCVGIRSTADRISATKAAWWGSMGLDCVATALSCYGLGDDTDVGVDFEGCVRCSAVGCYVKDFRYGCYATFFYSDGVVFDSCCAEVTTEGYRVFTINNSSQNANNRSVTYSNCMFSGVGCCSVVYQQGAVSDLVISNCTFRNVVLHLDSLNNGRIGISNLNMAYDQVPVDGRVFNSVTYYAALVINASVLALRDTTINSSVSWTGVAGESVGVIMLSRSSNANALHRVDGGGVTTAQFGTDVIFANMGTNNGITLRYEVDKFIFANKTYKTLLFSTSTLMPIGLMRGKTVTFSDFPTSITDNQGYADTYYTRRQQFINQSPTAGGILGTVVVTAGVGSAAVTANIPIS